MATTSRHLCRTVLQASRTIPTKRKRIVGSLSRCQPSTRQFATSRRWRAERAGPPHERLIGTSAEVAAKMRQEGRSEEDVAAAIAEHRALSRRLQDPSQWRTSSEPATPDDLEDEERDAYDAMSPEDQTTYLGQVNHLAAEYEQSLPSHGQMVQVRSQADAYANSNRGAMEIPYARADPRELGYWGEDEDDEFGQVEDDDDDWDESMMTAVAESQLELHREIRQYMRVAAWDMPLLNKFAKPFEKPTHATPLRFRYTTYMGEFHPAQKKIVVQFATKDLQQAASLSEAQRIKLIKLAGVRYNPSTDTVRMSCEKFEHAAQNKRYLGDMVDKLITEARDSSDMFEDIPLDFRHHKEKKKPQFPEEWKLTQSRVEELSILRQAPLKQLAAAQQAQEAERTRESEQQRKIAEFIAAQPLGRREEPRDRPGDWR